VRAMILAAGRGERMGALTDTRPKPLLEVAGKPLIQYHVEKLVEAGFGELVVNTSWLGHRIEDFLGDGAAWGCEIAWSAESEALETAGGIVRALPLLGEDPFAVVNADVWTEYDFKRLRELRLEDAKKAHLVMVENPPHHPHGDFAPGPSGLLEPASERSGRNRTYSGLAVFRPEFFAGARPGRLPLRPLLDEHVRRGEVGGELFSGRWCDVGTPARLAELNSALRSDSPRARGSGG